MPRPTAVALPILTPTMPRTIEIDAEPTLARAFSGRNALTWLFLFRALLVAALLLLFSFPQATPWLTGADAQHQARLLLSAQALLVLASGLLVIARWPTQAQQAQLAVFLDTGVYLLLLHVSGGVGTGLGLLPGVAVVAGALLLEGRISLLFAALASLGVITVQLYGELYVPEPTGTYTQAGLLGLTYFLMALLAHGLMTRLRETERLAVRRGVDLANLSKLNEYVIQSLSTGVVVLDGERRVRLLNSAARRLLNAPDARTGMPLAPLAPALLDWLERELHGDAPPDQVLALGEFDVRPSLHLLGEHRVNGALIFLRDYRDLIRQAQDIKLASLGRLTASIAHNIRNPLSSVTHAAQLLAESEALGEEDLQLLGMIRRNALRIDETVTSVLELSRRSQAAPVAIDLGDWLIEFHEEYLQSNRLGEETVTLTLPEPTPRLPVRVDPRHLGQILRNLCDNARKHGTSAGEAPRVDLRLARDGASGELTLTVADHGPGVPPDLRRTIFEPFFTTSSSGTGLGLYAAREFAEANGIRLEYRDVPGGGGAFQMSFSD